MLPLPAGMITTSLEEGTKLPLPSLNPLLLSLGRILPPTVFPLLLVFYGDHVAVAIDGDT